MSGKGNSTAKQKALRIVRKGGGGKDAKTASQDHHRQTDAALPVRRSRSVPAQSHRIVRG